MIQNDPHVPHDTQARLYGGNVAAMAAAYQVSARLLSAEQAVLWTRMAGFLAATSLAAGLAGFGSPLLQTAVGMFGALVTPIFWGSGERSWDFRDHFAAVMRAQEEWLGVKELGPLTTGDEQDFDSKLRGGKFRSQRVTFRLIVGAIFLVYLGIAAHGRGWLPELDKVNVKSTTDSPPAQPHK